MNFKIIFLAGVHGVGKGHLAQDLGSKLSTAVYSASNLIKQQKQAPIDIDKRVVDADKNQDFLIKALNNLSIESNLIILDGHFCLLAQDTVIEIPIDTFRAMPLAGVLLLIDDPAVIYERLMGRDGRSIDVQMIKNLQDGEIKYAKEVTEKLNIPLKIIEDSSDPINWIRSLFN